VPFVADTETVSSVWTLEQPLSLPSTLYVPLVCRSTSSEYGTHHFYLSTTALKHRQAGLRRRAQLSGASTLVRGKSSTFAGTQPCGGSAAACNSIHLKVCLLTWPRVQPDSDRAPLSAGSSFQSPEKLFAQYSHDLESGPLTVHSAIAAKLSSMSGYNKDQEHYAYGKCSAAHMTGTPGRMPQPGRMVPIGPREDP
jgi:hypothetical protein